MAAESTLSSKGRMTVPKGIREKLSSSTGDQVTFTLMPDGTVLLRAKKKSVMGLAGSLRRKGRRPFPVEQLSR
jgi:antitoxin PrlF